MRNGEAFDHLIEEHCIQPLSKLDIFDLVSPRKAQIDRARLARVRAPSLMAPTAARSCFGDAPQPGG